MLSTKIENPIIVAISAFGITLIVYAILFFLFLGIAGGVLYGIDMGSDGVKKTKQNNFNALKQFLSKMTEDSQKNKGD